MTIKVSKQRVSAWTDIFAGKFVTTERCGHQITGFALKREHRGFACIFVCFARVDNYQRKGSIMVSSQNGDTPMFYDCEYFDGGTLIGERVDYFQRERLKMADHQPIHIDKFVVTQQ